MRRALVVIATLVLTAPTLPGPAAAQAAPPPGDISGNVEFVANIPELKAAISIAFIDVMFVSTVHGVYSYDVSDPAAPQLLGSLPMYIWENEDMDVDVDRRRIFISRDPRGFTSPAVPGDTFPYGAVHIIDVSDPHLLTPVGSFLVPAGHTTTCVNDCDYVWTGGPFANAQTQPDYTGRPIYATDVRDPANPVPCPEPIDTGRNDGETDYAHDVQVDPDGIAWVSGAGGVRGYRTRGEHLDPLTGEVREATACDPIPYGGGGTPSEATPSRFMHNAYRNPSARIPAEDDPETEEDETLGHVLYATEENITSNCGTSGRFVTYDLRGTYGGEGWRDIDQTHFRMRALDTWTPQDAEGATACDSAHYFDDRGDGILAYAFYGQGTRFLDVSDPQDIRQIGYYRPDDANTWAPYWHDGYVFVSDFTRGVDIIRFEGEPEDDPVAAPPVATTRSLPMSSTFGYLCPIVGAVRVA
jgi:hypothetical protein